MSCRRERRREGGGEKGKRERERERLCPSEGWVNLEQDTPDGEDTDEEGCWTEEDDETLQLGYFGSESCLMTSPPGLRVAFSEAGWTVVTRKATWVL